MSSIKPDISICEEDSAEEVSGCVVVSGGNSTALLEFEEEVLNEMAGLV